MTWATDAVVEAIGFNPGPETTFVPLTPHEERMGIPVSAGQGTEGPLTSVVYALRMPWVCEPHDNGHHLLSAGRRSRPVNLQPIGVSGVDGPDDFPCRLVDFRSDDFLQFLSGKGLFSVHLHRPFTRDIPLTGRLFSKTF